MPNSLAIVYSRASLGIDAPLVTVETHLSNGLPQFSIVGLPEASLRESKDRVRSALINSNFEFPRGRITINLAPAELPKEGSRFDLAIALGILIASDQIKTNNVNNYEFIGELALSGELRPVYGVLPFALATHKTQRQLILPKESAEEASLIDNINLLPAQHLLEVCAHLQGVTLIRPYSSTRKEFCTKNKLDLSEIKGQEHGKHALEIAAAGQHSLLLIGPPGTGKTMLASRLPTILPPMSEQETLENAAILSICGKPLPINHWRECPFRAPHHSASAVAITGGGSSPRPGEISLAHGGVLFLDELPEFHRPVLESLREPLESGYITISRAAAQLQFPARFQLIAAMNPCPCGYFLEPNRCRCSAEQIQRYQNKISGPLLDRMDMHIVVQNSSQELFATNLPEAETSLSVRNRIIATRDKQLSRQNKCNAQLNNKEINQHCVLNQEGQELLQKMIKHYQLSARSYHRILRLARTIADMSNSDNINASHIAEALNYRMFDKLRSIST